MENLQAVSIRRFNRKTICEEGKPEYLPTKTVLITFKGQVLPQHAFLYKKRYLIEIYVSNVRFCANYYRHGHSKLLCKSKPRCIYCGNINHPSEDCNPEEINNPTYINCSENHLPTYKDCRTKQVEQKILSMAIRKHKTIQEVRTEFKEISNKRFRYSDFPEHQLSSFSQGPPEANNQITYSKPSYSSFFTSKHTLDNLTILPPSKKTTNHFPILKNTKTF